jgi:hypothetical protein
VRYSIYVSYVSNYPRGSDGYCAFCHGDPCNERSNENSLIAKFYNDCKESNNSVDTCPMCNGRAS